MRPVPRRRSRRANPTRLTRAGRGGFTLVEMLVSVVLVLLMMLMFAEIFGLAQETMTRQKGIAENDQKARILAEVLRRDLATRTFRSVYPFRLEEYYYPDFAVQDTDRDLLDKRRGYFSISENDPEIDTDDVLQFTVAADQVRYGRPGDRLYGRAVGLPAPTGPPATTDEIGNHPENDDGVLGNFSGASGAAEVSYFLRGSNLYRTTLLVRRPYTGNDAQPTIEPAPGWLASNTDPLLDYLTFSTEWPTATAPNAPRSFWQDFDYAAYREETPLGSGTFRLTFHGPNSLENDLPYSPYRMLGGTTFNFPRALSVPHLRFGHLSASLLSAPPFEFTGVPGGNFDSVVINKNAGAFFGRFRTHERSHTDFLYPGNGWTPFDGTIPASNFDASPAIPIRRGTDLMLANVHGFDVQVWDDLLLKWVNLGHEETTAAGDPGYYHRSRLRRPVPGVDHPGAPTDFGNRYDTWNPQMFVFNGTDKVPTGRTPYRPQIDNADPNSAGFVEVEFGEDDTVLEPPVGGVDIPAGEVPLRAVRLVIRYLDPASGQTRQTTIDHSLID